MPEPLLALEDVAAGYGGARVLDGVSLTLAEGEALALLGRNGAGKTTLVETVMGLTDLMGGRIALAGRDVTRLPADRRALAGIGWVPQERNVFASLTVEENLAAVARPGPWDLARVYGVFPRLRERRRNLGSRLSGGEQQMLALSRALVLNPRLLLLDEPLEGLAPLIVEELLAAIAGPIREEGTGVVIVEQHAGRILPLTDRAAILERGALVHEGRSRDLAADPVTLETFLAAVSRGQGPADHSAR